MSQPVPRILVVPSWYPPDGGYFFKEHSEALRTGGWNVDVLVLRTVGLRMIRKEGVSALGGFRVREEEGLRVVRKSYLKLPGNEPLHIRRWTGACLRLYEQYAMRFGRPDLILAHSVTWGGVAAARIRDKHGIPYVLTEHRSFFVWSTPLARAMVRPYHLPFFQRAFSSCSRLVLVSGSLLPGIRAVAPEAAAVCEILPNMIREDLFQSGDPGRSRDPFVFLWAGRFEHVKGLDVLLRAFSLLAEDGLSVRLRLAGRGSLRDELEAQAGALGLSQAVDFPGRLSREQMKEEYRTAHAFVLPSRYEAFGVVLIEALAAGLPVVATRSGGPEHIVGADQGLLVDPEDVEALAGAMKEIIRRRTDFPADRLRQSALDRFGQQKIVAEYGRIFRTILDEENAAGEAVE